MPLKIGITCYPTYGGSGVVATELGLELAQRGHEVHFITYAPPIRLDRPSANVQYHEVEVSRYPLFDYPPYDLALATRMAEVAELYEIQSQPARVLHRAAREQARASIGRVDQGLLRVGALHQCDCAHFHTG